MASLGDYDCCNSCAQIIGNRNKSITGCGHMFHVECLVRCMDIDTRCIVCREDLNQYAFDKPDITEEPKEGENYGSDFWLIRSCVKTNQLTYMHYDNTEYGDGGDREYSLKRDIESYIDSSFMKNNPEYLRACFMNDNLDIAKVLIDLNFAIPKNLNFKYVKRSAQVLEMIKAAKNRKK